MSNFEMTHLEWDSNFFEKIIYRLNVNGKTNIDELLLAAKNYPFDLVYLCSSQELNVSKTENVFLADKKVTFTKQVNHQNTFLINEHIISTSDFNETILQLAISSGNHSRFKLDTQLSHKFETMYRLWISKSLNREMATEVFAYTENNKEIGFVTIQQHANSSVIGLIAVDEKQQGKKIGSQLLTACENWCVQNNINFIDVATQMDNIQACEFYKRNGYTIKQVDYIYHYYKN
ncbi:MAG: GNAT family N-acetyltransferase [Bacteroidetes bacterium]|nr:GNAT family N-acetyltransferase [Bacteroidota bacterium]